MISSRLLDLVRRVVPARFVRYAAGSAVASVTSAMVLAAAYRGFGTGPRVASTIAFVAGAIVNFLIYRFWAWKLRDRAGVGRDFWKFAIVSVTTALIALGTTTLADAYARQAGFSGTERTLIVEAAYFGAFGVMFVAKFLVLDRFVFNARPRSANDLERSRDQVESTTRA